MNVVKLCWRLTFLYNDFKTVTKGKVHSYMYIGTMFIQVKQSTKNPEAGSWHQCTQIYTVVIGYPRSFLIWVIKFIRGSSPLKRQSSPKKRIHTWNFQIYITNCLLGLVMTNNCYTRAAFSKASTHERSPTEQ